MESSLPRASTVFSLTKLRAPSAARCPRFRKADAYLSGSHSAENLRLLCGKFFRRNQASIKHGLEFLERSQRVINVAGWRGCSGRHDGVLHNNATSSSTGLFHASVPAFFNGLFFHLLCVPVEHSGLSFRQVVNADELAVRHRCRERRTKQSFFDRGVGYIAPQVVVERQLPQQSDGEEDDSSGSQRDTVRGDGRNRFLLDSDV